MTTDDKIGFQSSLASLMEQFVREKRACGYRYLTGTGLLLRFDRFLCDQTLPPESLPRAVSQQWLAKRAHECASTHQDRISIIRQFAQFMCRLGYPADVPDGRLIARHPSGFSPHVFTHVDIRRLLAAVDQLTPSAQTPLRHRVMPEIFRLLYGCGFRISEVLLLRVADVDLNQGIITVHQGKFGRDRLVPPTVPLVKRLQQYAVDFGKRTDDAFFFPSHHDGPWFTGSVYSIFRMLLLQCGISHAGRSKGPRLHDFRHTFAVHTLLRWYREGADLNAKLPILATYLGHQSLSGTQHYLHLTAELYPEITRRTNADFGDVIPRRIVS